MEAHSGEGTGGWASAPSEHIKRRRGAEKDIKRTERRGDRTGEGEVHTMRASAPDATELDGLRGEEQGGRKKVPEVGEQRPWPQV